MARPSNRDARREQIVRGLMTVLPEYGYERSTTARIAKAAGLTAGLVHHHFHNKQAILLALGERLLEIVEARTSAARSPRGRLYALIDAHLALDEAADPGALACWVALGAEAVVQPEVGELYARIITNRMERFSLLIKDVCREEGRSARGLDRLATSLLAAALGYMQLGSAAPESIRRGDAASAVRALAGTLIDAQPTSPRRSP